MIFGPLSDLFDDAVTLEMLRKLRCIFQDCILYLALTFSLSLVTGTLNLLSRGTPGHTFDHCLSSGDSKEKGDRLGRQLGHHCRHRSSLLCCWSCNTAGLKQSMLLSHVLQRETRSRGTITPTHKARGNPLLTGDHPVNMRMSGNL